MSTPISENTSTSLRAGGLLRVAADSPCRPPLATREEAQGNTSPSCVATRHAAGHSGRSCATRHPGPARGTGSGCCVILALPVEGVIAHVSGRFLRDRSVLRTRHGDAPLHAAPFCHAPSFDRGVWSPRAPGNSPASGWGQAEPPVPSYHGRPRDRCPQGVNIPTVMRRARHGACANRASGRRLLLGPDRDGF